MLNKQANPLLVKTEQAVRAKLAPEQEQHFEKILRAGLLVLDGEQTHQMIAEQLKAQVDPVDIAGAGVAKLMGILMNQGKGTMPMKAGIPAATVLLLEALDRLEALGKIEVTNDTLAEAMQSMSSSLLQMLGVTPQKMDEMMKAKGQQPPAQPAPPEQPAAQPALIGAPQ